MYLVLYLNIYYCNCVSCVVPKIYFVAVYLVLYLLDIVVAVYLSVIIEELVDSVSEKLIFSVEKIVHMNEVNIGIVDLQNLESNHLVTQVVKICI